MHGLLSAQKSAAMPDAGGMPGQICTGIRQHAAAVWELAHHRDTDSSLYCYTLTSPELRSCPEAGSAGCRSDIAICQLGIA